MKRLVRIHRRWNYGAEFGTHEKDYIWLLY